MNPGDVENTWVPRVDQDDAREAQGPAWSTAPSTIAARPRPARRSPAAPFGMDRRLPITNRFRGYTPSSTGRSEGM
jgi:hypothetical protein